MASKRTPASRHRGAPRGTSSREPAPLKHAPGAELATAFARLVVLARKLPAVEESRSYGTPAIKVKGKLLARLRSEAEGGLAIRCDFVDRHMLMQADPEVFYVTEHYQNYPMVLIDLTRVRWDAMPQIVEQAWRLAAPPKLVAAHDASTATSSPHVGATSRSRLEIARSRSRP